MQCIEIFLKGTKLIVGLENIWGNQKVNLNKCDIGKPYLPLILQSVPTADQKYFPGPI